ncbi:uncharacterized protein [Elaeis guineensis]|uniref:holo-[acyl-carrier-protein] synthase n=1 Tax=Elaeis guineensis var. tenera TaxID=51953 RepID=A0A6I9Q7N7_ELAGV|nr:L-aminoadipate-semialdehyde dehydrogenase-phosphopantetheinyl transferase isoform X2 [Elaeis guineensis]
MEDGVRRWLVDISQWNPSQDQFSFLVSRLPPHEQAAVTRFIRFEDRKRALVSRLLQYTLVHEVLGIPFGKIILDRTIEGKPYLNLEWDFPFPNFNFNVSHHGDYVVLEWKKIVNAGISDEILAEFCRYWCLKEAYVKATGAGLGFGLHRLEFHHTNWTNISVCIDGVESREWRFCLFELDKKHWASIAKGHPRKAVESYQRALTNVDIEDEKYWNRLCLPDPGFIPRAVEQLLPL